MNAKGINLGTKESVQAQAQAQALDSCRLAKSKMAIHVASYVSNLTIATSGARLVSRANSNDCSFPTLQTEGRDVREDLEKL
jgi:hypothetical protein